MSWSPITFHKQVILWVICVTPIFLFAQTANVELGCFPLNVTFTPPIGSTTYYWDFKDGATSSLQNPVHVFITPGEYLVDFRTEEMGPVVGTILITVLPKPDLKIAVDPDSVCTNMLVQFDDQTTYAPGLVPLTLNWTFGNGKGDSGPSTSTTYSQPGNYTVSLSLVSNLTGCNITKSFPGAVTVLADPVASFTTDPDPPQSCDPPLEVAFTNTSSSDFSLTYSWSFGNGQTFSGLNPPQQTYTEAKSYPVILTATDIYGCSNTVTKNIVAGTKSLDLEYKDTICINLTWKPANQSPNGTHSWSFGPNATPSSSVVRNPEVVFFQSGTQLVTYTWTSPDKLCSRDTTFNVVVESPDALIQMDAELTCKPPFTVSTSINYQGSGTYMWTFDPDGQTSTEPVATFAYPAPKDDYSIVCDRITKVHLELITVGGCKIDTMRIDTFGFLTGVFTIDKYKKFCKGEPRIFSDHSCGPNTIVEWTWVFGDGQILIKNNGDPFAYTYDTCGVFEPYLIVKDILGCIDTSYALEIFVGCCSGTECTGGGGENKVLCQSDSLQLIVLYDPDSIRYYRVETDNFRMWHCPQPHGTGKDTLSWIFNHEPGSHPVYLSWYTTFNEFDSKIAGTIQVEGAWARASYMTNCEDPYTVMFMDSSMNATNRIWSFPDGTTYNSTNFSHTFSESGDYLITLEAWNQPSGCPPDRDTILVHIRDVKASFKIDPEVCESAPLTLDASASQDVNEVCYKGYAWYFPNGPRPFTSGVPIDSQSFSIPCEQEIILIVSDINGCQDTSSQSVNIQKVRTGIELDKHRFCLPGTFMAKAVDTVYCSTVSKWTWEAGGQVKSGNEVSFSFPDGLYPNGYKLPIRLSVETGLECNATATDTLTIYQPVSGITVDPASKTICEGQSIQYTGKDFTEEGSYLDFHWLFGNGQSGDGKTISAPYPDDGVYTVQLIFTEHATGCDDTIQTQVIVQPYPEAVFTSSLDSLFPICHPQTLLPLDQSQSEYPLNYFWDFGNGTTSTLKEPADVYTKGTWTLTQIVSTSAGCSDTLSKTYTLVGPEGDFEFDKDIVCLNEALTLTLKDTSDVSKWLWDFGDGTQQFGGNPVVHFYTYLPPDSTTIATLVLTDNTGFCTYQLLYPVPITVVAADFIIPPGFYCPGSPLFLENTSSNATLYQWVTSWGETSIEVHPVLTSPETGTYQITLTAINDTVGCVDTVTKSLVIEEIELMYLVGDTICPGDTAVIALLDTLPGFTILWSPSETLISPDSASTQATPSVTTTYTVSVVDSTGCMASGQVTVVVIEPLPIFLPWDTMVIKGVPVILPGPIHPYYTYTWNPGLGLSCTNCPRPELISELDQEYTLTIGDQWGCFETSVTYLVDVVPDMIDVPNLFTPNGDQTNSYFQIYVPGGTLDDISVLTMKVYSRWGTLVYDNATPDTGWDGKYNGEPCPMDVYAYVIEVEFIDGRREAIRGDITLVR